MKLFTVMGAVQDSGEVIYGVFESREKAEKFVNDNWIYNWAHRLRTPEEKVGSTSNYIRVVKDEHGRQGPDDYCSKDEVFIEEFELNVPIALKTDWYRIPAPYKVYHD